MKLGLIGSLIPIALAVLCLLPVASVGASPRPAAASAQVHPASHQAHNPAGFVVSLAYVAVIGAAIGEAPVTRAKFVLNSITRRKHTTYENGQQIVGEAQTLELGAVCDGSEENKRFFKSTPHGELKLSVVNPEVVAGFELGKAYYLDLTPAD